MARVLVIEDGGELSHLLTPEGGDMLILMVTRKGDQVDRVVGLELGEGDHVVEQFRLGELELRIGAELRRRTNGDALPMLEMGELKIDRRAHRVWVGAEEVALTNLEYDLLRTLCERTGEVLSRAVLLRDIWGVDAGVTARTIDAHVKRLREKLGASSTCVETVRGVGYRYASAALSSAPARTA
jgi:two-component system phosphate regulon response regulator PhoB